MREKSPFSRVDHIGLIVRDVDKAAEYYESLDIGPFEPLRTLNVVERKYLGKPITSDTIELKVKMAQIGPVKLEMIQPVKGQYLWEEFLETKGEGINHIGFLVDDIDKEENNLVQKGLTLLYSARFQKGGGAAYFDTRKVGGVLFELTQWPPE